MHDRVTQILSPFSGLSQVPDHILKRAAERGTEVHKICDALISDMGIPEINPDLQGYINSFEEWSSGKQFVEKPPRLYCDKHMITGECDGLYQNETGLTLFDLKTSLKENKTWSLQGSAYEYLAKQAGYNITQIEFVKLSKDGSPSTVYIYESNFELFLTCLNLYRYFFSNTNQECYLDYL